VSVIELIPVPQGGKREKMEKGKDFNVGDVLFYFEPYRRLKAVFDLKISVTSPSNMKSFPFLSFPHSFFPLKTVYKRTNTLSNRNSPFPQFNFNSFLLEVC